MGTRLKARGKKAIWTPQPHHVRAAARAAGDSESFPEPKDWETWVRTIELKSGSSIKRFSPMGWQSEVADLIINRQSGKRKSYVFAKSRQAGASTEILSIVNYLAVKKAQLTALFLHKTYGDSAELGKRNRKLLRAAKVPLQSDAALCQVLGNGSTIYYRSGDPDTAGRGLDSVDIVVYEECSFYSDLKGCVETIGPAQSWCEDAISIFVTTPNGKIGPGEFYWRLLSGGNDSEIEGHLAAAREGKTDPCQIIGEDDPITRIIVHWRAVAPFAAEPDFKGRIMAESGMTEESFAQEYDLDFTTKLEESVFDFALVKAAAGHEPEPEPEEGEVYYAGLDPAGAGADHTVFIILKKSGDKFNVEKIYRRKSGTSEQHMGLICDMIKKYKPICTTIEKNSIGALYLERITSVCGGDKIEGFNTSQQSKALLIGRINLALERGEISFPSGPIEQELLAFRRNGEKLEAAQGAHDDCVMALGLALTAAYYGREKLSLFGEGLCTEF